MVISVGNVALGTGKTQQQFHRQFFTKKGFSVGVSRGHGRKMNQIVLVKDQHWSE